MMTPHHTDSDRTQRLLAAARAKLLAPHVPALLRMTAFLRISYSAQGEANAYSQLMQALSQHHPEWWTTCEVTASQVLYSHNPEIQALLTPIVTLHSSTPAMSMLTRSVIPMKTSASALPSLV